MEPHFNGATYSPSKDYSRLKKQHDRVRECMLQGGWYTLEEIAQMTGDPASSVSAQLRHLRKERFGSWIINKRRRGSGESGLWEYQIKEPEKYRDFAEYYGGQEELFQNLLKI